MGADNKMRYACIVSRYLLFNMSSSANDFLFFTADQILGGLPTGGQSHCLDNEFLSITIKTKYVSMFS